MARIKRKELKRNELAESFGRTVDYVSHHRRGAVEAVGAAVAVLVLAAGFILFRGWREHQAGKELSAALEILEAPLSTDPGGAVAFRKFSTPADREREATKHLREAAAKGGTDAGRRRGSFSRRAATNPPRPWKPFRRRRARPAQKLQRPRKSTRRGCSHPKARRPKPSTG